MARHWPREAMTRRSSCGTSLCTSRQPSDYLAPFSYTPPLPPIALATDLKQLLPHALYFNIYYSWQPFSSSATFGASDCTLTPKNVISLHFCALPSPPIGLSSDTR